MGSQVHQAPQGGGCPPWGHTAGWSGTRPPGRVAKGPEVGQMWPSSWHASMTNAIPRAFGSLGSCNPSVRPPHPSACSWSPRDCCSPQTSPTFFFPSPPPKKPVAGLGAAAAGGVAAGRAAEGPGAAGTAAGGSLPGGLCAQREPGAGRHPVQAGGAEVGSLAPGRGWWGEGRGGSARDVRCQTKDRGDADLPSPQG